jgi:hypothetical protein
MLQMFFVLNRKCVPMKGFSEFRGQMFRMSYDPGSREFVNVPVPRNIAQTPQAEVLASKTEDNFKPKIVSRSEFKTRSIQTKVLGKKRA